MNWRGILFLGGRYLAGNRAKTVLLVLAFTLVWLLPAAIALVVGKVEEKLRARASGTPLVLGHAGSALELTFNALYFSKPEIATIPANEADAISATDLADAIPVYSRFSAGGNRIVGTTIDYFFFRDFSYRDGRALIRPGECVVGSAVAAKNGIAVGDAIISSPETLFDLAGVYPLKMTVCGVLEPTGSPDDHAIFVDLKTSWIIEGLGHGHQAADQTNEEKRLASDADEESVIRLNASIEEFNEINSDNIDSFHFHGEMGDNPITAVIVIPRGAKEQALLKGRFETSTTRQLITPSEEMDELFATVFSVQRIVLWLLVAVGIATLMIGAMVFLLSNRLRREEFRHLRHLGASAGTLRGLIVFEGAFVVIASLVCALLGLAAISALAPFVIERMIG